MNNQEGSRQRIRLFRSDFMEWFTVISPRAFVAIWSVVLALIVYTAWGSASIGAALGLVVLGLIGWTLFEYALHRFFFHWETKWKLLEEAVFVTHGNHHIDPNDPDRNLMPPIVSMPISGAIWAGCVALFGSPGTVLFLGFITGYVAYDCTHYACHQFAMRSPALKYLRRHHIRHHYARQDGNYAITGLIWDHVFGTFIPTKSKRVSGASA